MSKRSTRKPTNDNALEEQLGAVDLASAWTEEDLRNEWFHEDVLPYAKEIRFVRKRLCFNGKGRAPFPSLIIIFGECHMEAGV